jgi:CRISPR-associated protein Csm1
MTNLLYASGGKFYLLLANCYDSELKEIMKEINRGLLKKYNGEISLSIGWCPLKGSDFFGKKFPDKWGKASIKANEEKRRKFSFLSYGELFAPSGHGGDKKLCDVCKKEDDLQPRDDDSEIMLCKDCADAERLGKSLFRANYLIEVYNEKEGPDNLGFEIPFLATKYYLSSDYQIISRISAERLTIYKLNSTAFIIPEFQDKNYSLGFKFIGGTTIPQKNGNPLTFNDFADKSEGIKRLGILRMDVDNLGRIFIEGFGNRASISRVTTLSRMLALFFNGYLNTICQKYKEMAYIIYSGGDDLFIVGSWHIIVDLAEEIRTEFKEFTAHNPSFTLSGGIALSGKKYPIYRGADHAGDAEELAKSYKRKGIEKDAITFLNKPLSWGDMEISRDIKDLLYNCLATGKPAGDGNKKLSRGILDRLRRIYLLYETNKNYWKGRKELPLDVIEEKTRYNKWLWRSVYFMDRLGRENELFKEDMKKVKEALYSDCFEGKNSEREIIDFIDIPTRWVEFLVREEK